MTFFDADPFRTFERLTDHLEVGRSPQPGLAIDVYRRGTDLWIHADLPGIAPESIEVVAEQGVLTIAAKRVFHHEPGDRIYRSERPVGPIRRSIRLGRSLDSDRIEADYHDGVLTIRLPWADSSRSRRIPVTAQQSDAIDVESTLVDVTDDPNGVDHDQ